jgi:hypothetical protein
LVIGASGGGWRHDVSTGARKDVSVFTQDHCGSLPARLLQRPEQLTRKSAQLWH